MILSDSKIVLSLFRSLNEAENFRSNTFDRLAKKKKQKKKQVKMNLKCKYQSNEMSLRAAYRSETSRKKKKRLKDDVNVNSAMRTTICR